MFLINEIVIQYVILNNFLTYALLISAYERIPQFS